MGSDRYSNVIFLWFMIVSAFYFSLSYGMANFTKEPPKKSYVVNGSNATLIWKYHVNDIIIDFSMQSPKWDYNGIDIGYIDAMRGRIFVEDLDCPENLKGRVYVVSMATLVIETVTSKDGGTYVCTLVMNTENNIPSEITLIVTKKPTFIDKLPASTTVAIENNELNITCTATGPPSPNITWVKVSDEKPVAEGIGSAILSVGKIQKSHQGVKYRCEANNNPNEQPVVAVTTIEVYYPPEFTRSPVNTTVTQGDTIILYCQATANPPISSISWTRENNAAIKSGFTQCKNGTLLIPKANKTDVGKYICMAKNVFNLKLHNATATAVVTVKYQPSISDKSENLIVKEGGPVKLKCKAVGYPAPNITWSKSPGHIGTPNTGEWYNISSAKRSDDGTYTCTASNGIGNADTADIKVTVQFKPTIAKAASNTTGTSWNGNSITLRCKWSSANPAPTWTWYKPDNSNINDAASSIDKGSEVTVTTGKDDYGSYRCEANNVAGSDVHQINVTQMFPPGPPNVSVTTIEASSVTVRWTKPAYVGGSPVTGYKLVNGSKTYEFGELKMEHTVIGLTRSTEYVVKLYAKNVVGYGNASSVSFKTKLEGAPALPKITNATVDQTSVTLTWLKPEENGGKITGYTIYKKVKDQDSKWKQVVHISGTPVTYTVKNLERGKTYLLMVTATNKFGESVKDGSKAKIVTIPDAIIPTPLAPVEPTKAQSSGGGDPNQTIIIVGVVVAVILILITAVISIVILRKKNIFGQGTRKSGRNESAAYHNDVYSNDSLGRQAAVINLNGNDDIPTYAAVDMSKKTKKKTNDIPTYAAVDKSKKKRPGEIIYAELADFNTNNTNNTAAGPRPDQYAGTDYADISQFQQQSEPEPTYANFQGRSKDYANVEDMSSQA